MAKLIDLNISILSIRGSGSIKVEVTPPLVPTAETEK
jgi:hypothetical protein